MPIYKYLILVLPFFIFLSSCSTKLARISPKAISINQIQVSLPSNFPKLEKIKHDEIIQSNSFKLDNDLTVSILPHEYSPLVNLRLFSKCTQNLNSSGRILLDKFVSLNYFEQLPKKKLSSSRGLQKQRNFSNHLFGDWSFSVNKNGSELAATFLNKDLSKYLKKIERFKNTTLDKRLFNKALLSAKLDLLGVSSDPIKLAYDAASNLIYPSNHPYQTPYGDRQRIEEMTLAKLQDLHQKCWQPANLNIVISSSMSQEMVKDILAAQLSTWENSPAQSISDNLVKSIHKPRKKIIYVLNKKELKQAELLIAYKTIPRQHKDFDFLKLLSNILGDNNARLFNDLRRKQALTYRINSYQEGLLYPGLFYITSGSRYPQLSALLAGSLAHVDLLANQEIAISEIKSSQRRLEFNLRKQLENSSSKSKLLAYWILLGLDVREFNRLTKSWRDAKQGDLKIIANKYLRRPVIIIVGDSSKIRQVLKEDFFDYELKDI